MVDGQSAITHADRRESVTRRHVGLSVPLGQLEQTGRVDVISRQSSAIGEIDRGVADCEQTRSLRKVNDQITRSTDGVSTTVQLNSPSARVVDSSRASSSENHSAVDRLSEHPTMSLPLNEYNDAGPLHNGPESVSPVSALTAPRTAGSYKEPVTDVSKSASPSRVTNVNDPLVNQLYERYATDLSAAVLRKSFAILAQLQTIAAGSASMPDISTPSLGRQLAERPVGRGEHVITDSGLYERAGGNTGSGQFRDARDNCKNVGNDELLEDMLTLTSGSAVPTSSEHVETKTVETKMREYARHGWLYAWHIT